MKFLIVSEGGDGVGLALRLQAEGNDVRVWIRDSEAEKRGEGLVEHAKDYAFGEVIVADCTGAGPLLDHMREQGSKVVGGSAVADRLESDRSYAREVMRGAGIKTPTLRSFDDWDDAASYIEKRQSRLVFKPAGRLSGVVPSYVSSDADDMLEVLSHFKTSIGADKPEFALQDFVEGVAVSSEGWFDGRKWVLPFNHTLERKQLMNGDLGPSGGCTGNVVWCCADDDCPLCAEGIRRMEGFLREHDYRGAIDLNAVVGDDGLSGLEFTPRFGYDAFPTLLHGLYDGDFSYLLYKLAVGDGPDTMDVVEGYAAGVRISVPPWPSEEHHAKHGVPIRGLNRSILEQYFYPYDVMLDAEGNFVASGGYGILGVMNAHGDSIGEAFAKAYLRCKQLKVVDKQLRTDLPEVFQRDHRKIFGPDKGWVGVDLDGTLARYSGWSKSIGEPVPLMVNRVKRWLADGKDVRVVTARGSIDDNGSPAEEQLVKIHEWLKEHVGAPMDVTASKDPEMTKLWDDRVIQVEENTGRRVV